MDIITGVTGIASAEAMGSGGSVVPTLMAGSAGIPSAEAMGTGGAILPSYTITGVAGVATAEAMGSGGIIGAAYVRGLAGIVSAEDMGTTGVVFRSFVGYPGAPFTGLRVFIAGEERAAYVAANSLRISKQIGSRQTCNFTLYFAEEPTWRPSSDDEVIVYWGETRIFGGGIESTSERCYHGNLPVVIDVACSDYGILCERRICGFYFGYWGMWTTEASLMVSNIVKWFMKGTGIQYVDFPWTDPNRWENEKVGPMIFNYIPVSEAITQICDAVNYVWTVDPYKNLRIFPKDNTAAPAAPCSLLDSDGSINEITMTTGRSLYRNRQGVKNSRALAATWMDEFPRDWYRWNVVYPPHTRCTLYVTSFLMNVKPTVLVKYEGTDSFVEETVVSLEEREAGLPHDWVVILGSNLLYRSMSRDGLYANEDTIQILYPSPLPAITWEQDEAEIAAHGLVEAVEEVNDIMSITGARAYATALLARGKVKPTDLTIKTTRTGFEPGQILTVTTTRPPFNGEVMVDSVDIQEVGKAAFFWTTIRASNSQLQRAGSGIQYFERLIRKARKPIDRTTYHMVFTLAESIEGFINPGLTVGVKNCIRVAPKDGTLRDVTLRFKSVDDGTPTQYDIVIDILQNGYSIFAPGAEKVRFPANSRGTITQWKFSLEPLTISQGDIFTINVEEADSLATDGILDMTVYG